MTHHNDVLMAEADEGMPPLEEVADGEETQQFTKQTKRRKTDRKRKSAEETETALEANYPSAQLVAEKRAKMEADIRRVAVPPHRYQTLKRQWAKVTAPIVNELKLQIRYNLRTRCVEIRCPDEKTSKSNLQKAADFVHAFLLGFEVDDAIALIRLDHLFLESFEVNDVKRLSGDHLSRAIGRIAGKDGRVKMTIENVTKTRVVLANDKIHLLGAYSNLRVARHTICSLIMGTPINKIYGNLRNLSSRLAEEL
ncbi:hypothetical protein niasHS_001337 [Heterodera schachtii]|uniref:PNO1 second type I KH domain-containing protein n=1 Tax=Heterodera schachtii TaxID=97005 RepID=A0ABD2KM94_HETSC